MRHTFIYLRVIFPSKYYIIVENIHFENISPLNSILFIIFKQILSLLMFTTYKNMLTCSRKSRKEVKFRKFLACMHIGGFNTKV